MVGYRFKEFIPGEDNRSQFERMLDIFTQLLTYTSGDVAEALS